MAKDPKKQGKASREKGKRGELELVHLLRDFYGYPVRRGYVFQHESDLVGLPGVHVECKRKEKINIYTDYKQAVREAEKRSDGVPVVFHRRSNEDWLVIMGLSDFMDFYGGWNEHSGTDPEGE